MGILNDNLQEINRGLVSERAEKKALREAKNNYKNYLYKCFYNNFAKDINRNPDNIYAYWIIPENQKKILDKFTKLEISMKIEIYFNILNKVYRQFKNNYKMNISTENTEKTEQKQLNELLKIYNKNEKIIQKQKEDIEKANNEYNKLLIKRNKEVNKGILKTIAGMIIGGQVANKTYKKLK